MSDQPKSDTQGELLLASLAAIASEVALRVLDEVKPEVAKYIGDEIAVRFSDQWGAETHYIPKGRVFRKSAIYRQIWERFTGDNAIELRRELGISLQHLYRILARERERERSERQSSLPLQLPPPASVAE